MNSILPHESADSLRRLLTEPTISVEDAAALAGLSRAKGYVEARKFIESDGAEGLPCVRFGKSVRVPSAPLRRLLHIDHDAKPEQIAAIGAA